MSKKYITKDSGKRKQFNNGFQRDTEDDKVRYDLIYMPILKRWAELMTRGAIKYDAHNWKKANDIEALDRFKSSLWRHFIQYIDGDTDEDHMAAIIFNMGGIELLKEKLQVDINGNKNK